MNDIQKKVISSILSAGTKRIYYVYRLVDPRTLMTFYIGKGCGDRMFQHVDNWKNVVSKDEDDVSLKANTIAAIKAAGKEVIHVIHRWGMTEKEAFEVEAALIDAFPGLTNKQNGHGCERGMVSAEDFYEIKNLSPYSEPSEKYIIIKTTMKAVAIGGSLYEATRYAWRANIKKAKNYKFVLAVIYGIVRGVYEVDSWYQEPNGRIAFHGHPATGSITALIGKQIPEKYRQKGASYPFIYKKK